MQIFLVDTDFRNVFPNYKVSLLRETAYKFVGWSKIKKIIVMPVDDGLFGGVFHETVVDFALEKGIIDTDVLFHYPVPDIVGTIRINFGDDGLNRICSWHSQGYNLTTSMEHRPLIREILGLEDVVYRN